MRVVERPLSDLLRHPADVTNDLDTSDVLLRRRDEPDLRLTRADREGIRSETFSALTRVFRNLSVHHPEALADALADAFRWIELLPASDRQRFVDEFSSIVGAVGDLDSYDTLSQFVGEWRATAEIYADPVLANRLRRQIDASGSAIPAP